MFNIYKRLVNKEESYGMDNKHSTKLFTRYWIKNLKFLTLHIFYRGDRDLDFHTHKQSFITFPLVSYIEEVYNPRTKEIYNNTVKAFRFYYRNYRYAHRIICSKPMNRPIVTLVLWVGPRYSNWGFWLRQQHKYIDSREYIFSGNY